MVRRPAPGRSSRAVGVGALTQASKPASAVLGRWRITVLEGWDASYIDLLGPGYMQFDRNGGTIAFGVVQISLDPGYSPTGATFTFHGSDEGTEVCGDGEADIEPDGTLAGEMSFHQGDDMPFSARRWQATDG